MCSRVKTLSERPDWRVSSAAVVPVKISWLTIPPSEPSSRGPGALDATSSASRFGQGPSRRPQRVFPDRRPPPHHLWSRMCSEFVTKSVRFRFPDYIVERPLLDSLDPFETPGDDRTFPDTELFVTSFTFLSLPDSLTAYRSCVTGQGCCARVARASS